MAELALSKVVWLRAHPLLPEGKGVHPSELQLSFPGGSAGKESACNAEDLGSIYGLGRFPWRRERLPTPVFFHICNMGTNRTYTGSSKGLDARERHGEFCT